MAQAKRLKNRIALVSKFKYTLLLLYSIRYTTSASERKLVILLLNTWCLRLGQSHRERSDSRFTLGRIFRFLTWQNRRASFVILKQDTHVVRVFNTEDLQ